MTKKEPKGPPNGDGFWKTIASIFKDTAGTHNNALDKVIAGHRGVIHVVWIIGLLAVVLGFFGLYLGYILLPCIAIGVGFFIGLYAIYALSPRGRTPATDMGNQSATPAVQGQWSRVTVKLPIPSQPLNDRNR